MSPDLTDRFCDLVFSQGAGLLDDPRRLRAFLADVYPDRPALRMGLYTAVSAGMVVRLRSAASGDRLGSEVFVLRGRLHDEFGLNEGLSDWVLVTLCASLGIDLPAGFGSAGSGSRSGGGASGGSSGGSGTSGGGAFGIASEYWRYGVPGEPGSVFREFADAPEMVVIPAGSFVMGSPPGEEGALDREKPERRVRFRESFALGLYAVRFEEYDHFCIETVRHKPPDEGWGRGLRPAIHVSWIDAQAYCAWLSEVTGNPYRLPSESEWEYACRAGMETPFWTGETISTDQANYDGRYIYGSGHKGGYREQTTPVGTVGRANPFGLFDMHGNVWEWCEDIWHDDYSSAPRDGSARLEVDGGDSSRRVLRGGSWSDYPWTLRSAHRARFEPGNRSWVIGFRLARTLSP